MDEKIDVLEMLPLGEASAEIKELATALALAQAAMGPAPKDKENPFFKSKYADLASVWEACREPLTKNGLSVTQLVRSNGDRVIVRTILLHSSGQFITTELSMKAEKETPQALGSVITYARRYSLSAIVGISSEEDDDGNIGSGKPEVTRPQAKGKGLPEEIKQKFAKARKLLGEEDFLKILGNEGYENVEQIIDVAVANQILKDMGDVYTQRKK